MAESGAELAVVHLPGRLWVPRTRGGRTGRRRWLPARLSPGRAIAGGAGGRGAGSAPGAVPGGDAAARDSSPRGAPWPEPGPAAGSPSWPRESRAGCSVSAAALGSGGRAGERGQALPALLGAGLILILAALALAAIGGAATGRGRVQRAADLAALSAARSMRDDTARLLAPATLPDGSAESSPPLQGRVPGPSPPGGVRCGTPQRGRSGAAADRLPGRHRLSAAPGPRHGGGRDRSEPAPGRRPARRSAGRSGWSPRRSPRPRRPCPPGPGCRSQAEGGGYSGPLVYRDGEGMRPDVAAAYDRMAAAARRAGLDLLVVSGFRSDAEQARLFAQHPDPRWVAPPGHSLHRCATELDLGPSSAYGWLARARESVRVHSAGTAGSPGISASTAGPPPCSEAGNSLSSGGRPGEEGGLAEELRAARASSRPGSASRCCARRPAGTSRRACSRPS